MVYGLDWFATVPPVVAIAGNTFGKNSVGSIYGLIFMSHQLGGAAMAQGGGIIFDYFGDYVPAFLIGALLAAMAAVMSLAISKDEPRATFAGAAARTGRRVTQCSGSILSNRHSGRAPESGRRGPGKRYGHASPPPPRIPGQARNDGFCIVRCIWL